jgi:transposase
MAQVNVDIVKRSDHAKGFVVLPKRWVVERQFAWLGGADGSQGIGKI